MMDIQEFAIEMVKGSSAKEAVKGLWGMLKGVKSKELMKKYHKSSKKWPIKSKFKSRPFGGKTVPRLPTKSFIRETGGGHRKAQNALKKILSEASDASSKEMKARLATGGAVAGTAGLAYALKKKRDKKKDK